jgi:hypothetical protein
MKEARAQSAIEFLSVYGYVFLIIAIVVAVIALMINVPSSVLPSQCSFYSGFTCSQAALVKNTAGAALIIQATDAQPGTVSTNAFNAILNYRSSATGACTPQKVVQGQTIYCVANFSFTPVQTSVYAGTFDLYADYCAPAPQNVSTAPCMPNSNTVFGGSVRVQPLPSNVPVNTLINSSYSTTFYIPITLVNSQDAASSAPFQQEISFLPTNSLYSKYERSNLGNIRFYFGNNELTSWCETNCLSSSSSNAVFWVRLPFAIQPYSNTIVRMEFMSNTVNYDSAYAGEAPSQSALYAQYDNGASVFNFYDNFAGNTLSTKWIPSNQNSGIITVDNGIQLSAPAANTLASIASNTPFSTTIKSFISEALLNVHGSTGTAIVDSLSVFNNTGLPSLPYGYYSTSSGGQPQYYFDGVFTGTSVTVSSSNTQYNILDQQIFSNLSYFSWDDITYSTGAQLYTNSITIGATGQVRLYYAAAVAPSASAASQLNIQLVRVRGMPPNYVMPSVYFGPVSVLT